MTFSVQPVALDGYAAQVDRAGDDATAVQTYLLGYKVDSGWDGLLIEAVGDSHVRSMDTARELSGRVATVLADSHNGLAASAVYYRRTDTSVAAAFDATMPGRCASIPTALEQRWAGNPCGPGFGDSREPAGRLKPVDDVEYTHPLAVLDNISVSEWALKGFDFVFGFNPLEKVSEFFIGDWQAVAKGGKALGHAGEAFDDVGYNVQGRRDRGPRGLAGRGRRRRLRPFHRNGLRGRKPGEPGCSRSRCSSTRSRMGCGAPPRRSRAGSKA